MNYITQRNKAKKCAIYIIKHAINNHLSHYIASTKKPALPMNLPAIRWPVRVRHHPNDILSSNRVGIVAEGSNTVNALSPCFDEPFWR